MKKALKLLAKTASISLGLTAAASAIDPAIENNIFGSDISTLIIWREEMNDIMNIVKSLEESGLLKKGIRETTENKAKQQKGGLLGFLLGKVSARLLGNL